MKLTDIPGLRNFTHAQLLAFLGIPASQPGQIVGLNPKWTSATVLGASAGSCYIESLGYSVYGAPADITPSSPSNNTWYHMYGFASAGALAQEASTAVPVPFATPVGFARSKTGDASRRYLYSARTNGSGNFYEFRCDENGFWRWTNVTINAAPFRVLNQGSATSSTNVDCSAVVPVTSRSIYLECNQENATYSVAAPGDVTPTGTNYSVIVPPTTARVVLMFCDSSQTINYYNTGGGGALDIDLYGFYLQR